jgi:hypothetical protein
MKKIFSILLVALIGVAFSTAIAQKVVDVKSKDVIKTRGSNPHIKSEAPINDANPVSNPGIDKDGGKSRGEVCKVTFVNQTGYFIKIYLDGVFYGAVDAWGEYTISARNGYKSVYGLTSGGMKEWTSEGSCSEKYTFNLQ